MTTTRFLSSKDRQIALALSAVLIAALSVLIVMPSADAEDVQYKGEIDLYGYTVTMGLVEPDQVSTVEWDFGDGSETETVTLTADNPTGSVTHTYAAKGDYTVTATMRNQYVNESGETVDGESKITYLYHILGYPVITFNSMGGSDVASIEGTKPSFVATKPADPTQTGLKFTEWYTDEKCTVLFDWTSEVNKSITLYAGWAETVWTVHYDLNGGSGAVSDQRVADGKTAAKPSDPSKTGCRFDGWYNGKELFDFETAITADIELTAHWTEVYYTVTFDSAGGSAVAAQKVQKDSKATMPDAPTKDGFVFDGWYNGSSEFNFNSAITSNVTLTAHWKADVQPSGGDDSKKDTNTGMAIIFAIAAVLCIVALLITGMTFLGIPAAICAILAALFGLGVL